MTIDFYWYFLYNVDSNFFITEKGCFPKQRSCFMKKLLAVAAALLLITCIGALLLFSVPASRTSESMDIFHEPYHLKALSGDDTALIEPTLILDYTTKDAQSLIYTISFHQTLTEGEYTNLKASWHDPQGDLTTSADLLVSDIRYTVIVYRTSKSCQGEFYLSRSDVPTMGQAGTHSTWSWNATGEWETVLVENSAWLNAPEDATVLKLRFDPLQGGVAAGDEIDVQYIAFFATREEAESFDFAAYKAAHAPETEPPTEPVTRPAPDEPYDWPAPAYKEQETDRKDNHAGTLTYTPSEDGTTMTISYVLNGETVSYTVPNAKNYLAGGYAGVDDLNRALYNSEQVGAYDPAKRQIGLFYFLWHNPENDQGLYDLQKILDELGREGAANMSSGRYGGLGVSHWFAEPLYGYYFINDAWVMRKHVELLTNAGVDFLYIDATNGSAYLPVAIQLMSILHEFNEMGYDAPQIVFYTNTNSATVMGELQRDIYREELYSDTWYMIDGKPVIIAPTATNRRFTTMATQWPNDENRNVNAWPWMDFEWPQYTYVNEKGAPHAINVSIAQHSGTVCFSDSSLKGNYTNRGRSFVNPDNIPSTDPAFDGVLKAAYDAWVADPSLSNYGLNFQAQWDYALTTEVPTILVTGWNEWIAGNWGCFVDTASVEFSRDAEMARGYYFDNYYMQMIGNIQRAKGTAPIILQDARKAINVTGDFDQWADVTVAYTDSTGDTLERDYEGYGDTHYYNFSGRNDIVEAKVTSDTKNLYFYVKTAEDITKYNTDSSWMQLYLNVDRKTTGWYGYDFIINYQAKGDFTTTVAKYNGADGAYGFEVAGEVSYRVDGCEMMISVPMSLLGVKGYKEIDLEFKWGDSRTVYDEMEDFYCDGDVAPLGRLNFIYQNYIPGVSQIDYTEPETTAPVTAAPEATTSADTAPATTPATASKGCGSSMAALNMALAALCGVALLKKSKDE